MSKEQQASDNSSLFVEIRPPPPSPELPERVEVYITRVKPRQCGPLIKDIQQHYQKRDTTQSQKAIAHLKRVFNGRTQQQCSSDGQPQASSDDASPPTKKSKTTVNDDSSLLQVLLGPVCHENNDAEQNDWNFLIKKYACTPLERRWLPGRPAQSKEQLKEFNKEWTTIYFHTKTLQYQEQELALTKDQVMEMQHGMQCAIQDAKQQQARTSISAGAVIMCPVTCKVVATANAERNEQQDAIHSNPLCTSVLLAIQGVSRKERAAAISHGMDSHDFQQGQYLCTGYDLYTTREPSVFEAMACVHSRIRRVVLGVVNKKDGGLGGTGMEMAVQSLPTINHHYRVFCCAPDSKLFKECEKIHYSNSNGSC